MIKKRNVSVLGIISALSSFLMFSLLDAFVRISGSAYNVVETSTLQRLTVAIIMFIMLLIASLRKKSFAPFKTSAPLSHLARGILMFIFSLAFTYTFRSLPFATAYTIIFMLPIVTALIALITVREHIPLLVWGGIVCGFIGILLVLRPGIAPWNWGYLAAFIAICLEAPFFILTRRYHSKEHPLAMILYPQVISGILTLVIFSFTPQLNLLTIDYSKFYLVLIMCTFNILAQFFMNYSLVHNDSNISTSMQYSQVIYGIVFGYLFFKEVPDNLLFVVGTIIILASGYTVATGHLPFIRKKRIIENL